MSAPSSADPLRVACIGMGWWSDVLADAIKRSGKLKVVACYTRSPEKRDAFAKKYGCRPVPSYETILEDRSIEAIINTTPNNVHCETTIAAAKAGKASSAEATAASRGHGDRSSPKRRAL